MTLSTTPIAGVDLAAVYATNINQPYPPFKAGTLVNGDDGHSYIYASASAAIAADAVCILTEPALTMATGAGDWTAPSSAVASGSYAWFQKTAV